MSSSRIALIAVRAAPSRVTSEYYAVVVGTEDALGKSWRYICYPLNQLRAMLPKPGLSTGIDPFDESIRKKYGGFYLTPSDADPLPEFPAGQLSAAERSEFPSSSNLNQPAQHVSLVMRDIVEVRFYRAGASPFDPGTAVGSRSCLARLDTCRPIDTQFELKPQPPRAPNEQVPSHRRRVGSMLELSVRAKPTGTGDAWRGRISGFRALLDMRLALNAHAEAAASRPERNDTRGRIVLLAEGSGNRSLWKPDGLGNPAGEHGALFSRIWMGASLNVQNDGQTDWPWEIDGDPARYRWSNKTLVDLAGLENADRYQDSDWGPARVVPLLAALGLAAPPTGVWREFGFRVAAFDGPAKTYTYPALVLRFEMLVNHYSERFFPAIEEITVPGAAPPEQRWVYFAQEQRCGDINLPIDVESPVRWLITARLDEMGDSSIDHDAIARVVLRGMNALVGRLHAGLRAVRDGRPISVLPVVDIATVSPSSGVPWHAVGVLLDRTAHELDAPYIGSRSIHADADVAFRFSAFEPRAIDDMWRGARLASRPPGDVRLTVKFKGGLPRLPDEKRKTPRYSFEIKAPRAIAGGANADSSPLVYPAFQPAVSSLDQEDIPIGTRFELLATGLEGDARAVSIGALRLTLGRVQPGDMLDSAGFVLLRRFVGATGGTLPGGIDAVIDLPIQGAEPADQDDPESAVRVTARARRLKPLDPQKPDPDAPLLIPLEGPSGTGASHVAETAAGSQVAKYLTLTGIETATQQRDHTIALSLRAINVVKDKTPGTNNAPAALAGVDAVSGTLLVLDPRPLRIAAVEYQTLTAQASSESSEIAVWNAAGEGGLSWRVRDDNETVRLTLPPQVIGEAMEKNRADRPGKPKDINEEKPAAARFGSLTALQLDPTFADTRFREPGWNLRRILGQATQRSPGARLRGLRLELLYGLLTRVRSPDVWYTEIAGAIGEPALPILEAFDNRESHLKRHTELINGVLATERSRLAVDKLWKNRPDDDPVLEEGVSFDIRLREPKSANVINGPVTHLRWPAPDAMPDKSGTGGLINFDTLERTFKQSDDDRDSFPGGLAWAFESANILMSVYGKPHSDGGRVRGVHLSAYGGYGSQRALFDERKTVVETDTSQGRVHRYRLERIGRISCLWHRAKHVIVFERTVVPPAQFYNAEPIGLRQDELRGRAVLRKVEEYVEILQTIRSYPEDGHSLRACGFVVGAEFKSKKIRVDSDWGNDVRREGWRVPLWSRAFLGLSAAKPGQAENPDHPANLYPKPQIRLTVMGHDGASRAREIASPEKLYFYTSVVAGEGEDTDAWQPVRHVDFCDRPTPVVGIMRPTSADLTDAPLAPEPEYVPGYEDFTLDLVETDDAIALTHNRVPGGPSAVLRNVTVARGIPAPTGKPEELRTTVKAFGEGLALSAANARNEFDRASGRILGALEKVDRRLSGAAMKSEAETLVKKAFAEFKVEDLKQTVRNVGDVLRGVGEIKLDKACAGLEASVRAQIDGQVSRFKIVAQDLVKDVGATVADRIASGEQVVLTEIARFSSVKQRSEQMFESVKDLTGTLPADAAAALKVKLDTGVSGVMAQLGDIKGASNRVRETAAHIDRLPIDLPAEIAEIRARIGVDTKALAGVIDGNAAAVSEELAKIVLDATKWLKDLDADLAIIGDAKPITDAKAVVADADRKAKALRTRLDTAANASLPAPARRILVATGRAFDVAAVWLRQVAEDAANGTTTTIGVVRGKLAVVQKELDSVLGMVTKRIQIASNDANSVLRKVEAAIGELLDPVDAAAKELTKSIETQRQTLVSALVALADQMDAVIQAPIAQLETLQAAAKVKIDQLNNTVTADLKRAIEALSKRALAATAEIDNGLASVRTDLSKATRLAGDRATSALATVKTNLLTLLEDIAKRVSGPAQELVDQLSATCKVLEGFAEGIAKKATEIGDWIADSLDLDQYKRDLEIKIIAAIAAGTGELDSLKREVAEKAHELTRNVENRARQMVGAVQESVRDVTGASLEEWQSRAEGMYQKGDNALHALRALGDPPKTDRMGFNRPEVAYVLGEAKKLGVDMTPALALVNRVGDQIAAAEQAGKAVGELLDAFSIRLPTSELADQIIPQKLRNLSVADLLPDLGGVDFRGLLQRVGFPDLDDSEALKIRHGFDRATLTAWMEADIDVPFAEPAPLVEFGPVKIVVDSARFTSKARLAAGRDGTEKTMKGQIFGDWRVMCGGMTILTFRQTGLYFDQTGHIDFKVQPDRVELAEILQFLTQLVQASGQAGDFTVGPLMRGMVPAGVVAQLDLDMPDIQSGAFGISDLSIHILFGIAAIPEFEIFGELSVGSRLAPFTINVWILNGGGYLTQRLSFLPAARPRPVLTYVLDIGIVAGVGLGFSFGVISGGVYLQVGCGIAFTWTTAAGGNVTTVRVFILARGNVDVAGLITVGIALLLEVSYDGANMIGAGELTISVKISVFYTLRVSQRAEYVFAGESKKGAGSQADSYC